MLFRNEKAVFLPVAIIIWLWVGVCNGYCLVGEMVRLLVGVWGLVGVGLGDVGRGFGENLFLGLYWVKADYFILDWLKMDFVFLPIRL